MGAGDTHLRRDVDAGRIVRGNAVGADAGKELGDV